MIFKEIYKYKNWILKKRIVLLLKALTINWKLILKYLKKQNLNIKISQQQTYKIKDKGEIIVF